MSNRVGSHLTNSYSEEIEKDIQYLMAWQELYFFQEETDHCGGYPDINKTRMSVFLSHKIY